MSGFRISPTSLGSNSAPDPVLPAIPDDLFDALDRDPPPAYPIHARLPPGEAHSALGSLPSRTSSPAPKVPPKRDEHYSETVTAGRLPTIPSRVSFFPNNTNLEQYDQGDSSSIKGSKEKSSLWKAVSLSRPKVPSSRTKKLAVAAWASLGGGDGGASTSQLSPSRLSVASDSTYVRTMSRPPSSNKMRSPTTKAAGSKWLYEAQAATADVIGIESRRSYREKAQEESFGSVDSEGPPTGFAGGDLEEGRESLLLGEEEYGIDTPVVDPWRDGRGDYTHDLTVGLRANGYEEEDDDDTLPIPPPPVPGAKPTVPDLEDLITKTDPRLDEPQDSTLYSRRRTFEHGAPPRISIQREGESSTSGPSTAPIIAIVDSVGLLDLEAARGRSKSDGHIPLAQEQTQAALRNLLAGPEPILSESPTEPVGPVPEPRTSTAEFVVAIIGPRNVGKSTVIRRALKQTTSKAVTILQDELDNRVTVHSSVIKLGDRTRTIEVLEIDQGIVKYSSEGIVWPPELPPCDGAIVCYDATDAGALDPLAALLQAFWTRGSGVPIMVLACKSHTDVSLDAADPVKASEICRIYGAGTVTLDGGIEDPARKTKLSFAWMLRAIIKDRGDEARPSSVATSSVADSLLDAPSTSLRPSSPGDLFSSAASQTTFRPRGSVELSIVPESPTSADPLLPSPMPLTPEPPAVESVAPPTPKAAPLVAFPSPDRPGAGLKAVALDLHFSRDDLIEKFIFAAVTGNGKLNPFRTRSGQLLISTFVKATDDSFISLFLVVFRRFNRPLDVLTKLIERFDLIWARLSADPMMSRFAHMKLCGVLATWFHIYPGDFTSPETSDLLSQFLEGLLPRGATWVSHYAIELIPLVKPLANSVDPETSWAIPDRVFVPLRLETPSGVPRRPSLVPSLDSATSSAQSQTTDLELRSGNSRLSIPNSQAGSSSLSIPPTNLDTSAASPSEADTTGTGDSNEYQSLGSSSGGRKSSKSSPGLVALVELSNAFLDMPDDIIAKQITRNTWLAYERMTPRDVIRHVLAPRSSTLLRDPDSNVLRAIGFVNYLADWVATMILVQSKLKPRARMLEKFISIAYELRQLENFDSLMGVLAGLNSQPIFRLTETMELVSLKLENDRTKMPKRLRSLNKLMNHSKSFAAYRLALANSGPATIPYLGVHLQDITVINEVKSDMRNGLVNWSKFAQMGRSASVILDCSRVVPPQIISPALDRCIFNVLVLNKEEQYTLSYSLQARNSTGGRSKLRKLVDTLAS